MQRDNIKTLLNVLGPKLDKTEIRIERFHHLCQASRKISNDSQKSRNSESRNSESRNGEASLGETDTDSLLSASHSDSEVQLHTYQQRMRHLKKLYEFATRILDISHSKTLLALYEDLMHRIQTATEMELKQLADDVDLAVDHEISTKNSVSAYSNESTSISSNEECHSIDECPHTGELWNPSDIAFLPDNMLVVAEYDVSNDKNNRIQIFDTGGRPFATIQDDKLQPLGVCVSADGNIAVTDCQEKRVKIYTTGGIFCGEFGKGNFGWPYGIATTSRGQYIVTDAFNDVISIHQPDGKRIKTFGSSGAGNDQFTNPYHVTVDKNDNIIVSDCGNNCVKVFDINGTFKYKTSRLRVHTEGTFNFENKRRHKKLKAPRGVAVDPKGNILVADDHGRVSMFTSQGKYIKNVLTEEDTVKFPEGLATNSTGYLAVTEWNPHNMFAIKVFAMYE